MTTKIEFQLKLFGGANNREYTQIAILCLAECMTRVNVKWLVENPGFPHLYKSGIRYKNDDPNYGETMRDLPTMLSDGKWGDCASLGPARAAELRYAAMQRGHYSNFKFQPFIKWRQTDDGVWRFHVLVRWIWPNGRITFEDPSKVLGMGLPGQEV